MCVILHVRNNSLYLMDYFDLETECNFVKVFHGSSRILLLQYMNEALYV